MDGAVVTQSPGIGRLVRRIWDSTLGLKYIMAITGLALIGFLIVHIVGNLQVFSGPEKLNHYAEFLQSLGTPKWALRGGLLACVVLHIWSAARITLRARAARPIAYAYQATVKASYASRTMRVSGFIVFFFIAYHLLHFTGHLGVAASDSVYDMVVHGFQNPLIAGCYTIAMLLIGGHLSHGISSMFQSLGLTNTQYKPAIEAVGPVVAWTVTLAAVSIPVSIFLGSVK